MSYLFVKVLKMHIKRPVLISAVVLAPLSLSGCIASPEIQDGHLNDRVKACSAGFSEQAKAGLAASLNKAALSGNINGDIKEETKGIIFSEVPDSSKIKVYEDYIACIEKNWN